MNLVSLDQYVSHRGNASVLIIGSVYSTFPHVFNSSGTSLIPNPILELQDEQPSPSSPRIPILALDRSFLLHIALNPSFPEFLLLSSVRPSTLPLKT